jgi:hypothetical protein
MTLATYKDLCLDAADVGRVGGFWAAALGAELELRPDGVGLIRDDVLRHLWIIPVPEPKVVKNRVHLDVRASSPQPLLDLGATQVGDQGEFQVLQDPGGNELCVFPGDGPAAARPFALCVDAAEPVELARWWAGVLGGELRPGPDGRLRWLYGAAGMDGLVMKFVPVEDARAVKNRCHWDVVAPDVDALLDRGARVVRLPDGEIAWTVLSDIDGNVFCAFDR